MIADSIQHFMFLNPSVLLELGFHTDTRGSESFNQFHSEKWANETKEMLVRRGVSKERITAVGYGESQPLVSDTVINATKDKVYAEKLHALNRRFGHVKVLKK
jgi:outer membrane protein OmpA-like peptidoglycan-associated protein